jgi:YhfX-like, C-terminal domain
VRAWVNERLIDAELPSPAAIDYYGQLVPKAGDAVPGPGETVVLGFRIQAFVTRAYVAPIEGVSTGSPRLAGVWTSAGEPAPWP